MKINEKFTRRDFIKGTAVGVAGLYASKVIDPSNAQSYHERGKDEGGIQIIDAHAHPDRYRSSDTITDSLSYIKDLGMAASVFSAVGDTVFLSHANNNPNPITGTTEFYYTIRQLDYWLSGGNPPEPLHPNGIVEPGDVKLVLKTHDIPKFSDQNHSPGAIFAIEGGDALEGKVGRVNEFYGLGVRLITVIHYRNNSLGDTMMPHRNSQGIPDLSPGPYNGGLTETGKEVIERMRKLGMIIDVAHAHHDTLMDILDMKTGPVIDSHTSLCTGSTDPISCGLYRLRTWDEMEGIAKTGGIVCNWPQATNNRNSFQGWANELFEMKQNLGIRHVGIGTDGSGSLPNLISGYNDIRDLTKLIEAMNDVGFSQDEIEAIMGRNFYRIFKHCVG